MCFELREEAITVWMWNEWKCDTRSSSKQCISRASRELSISRSAVHNVVPKRLRPRSNKIQIVQKLQANAKPTRDTFALDMSGIDDNNVFLNHVTSLIRLRSTYLVMQTDTTVELGQVKNKCCYGTWTRECQNKRVVWPAFGFHDWAIHLYGIDSYSNNMLGHDGK
jgi:hypothetical protein